MTPLERAARALCKRNCGAEVNWPLWMDDARAVLLAIREPSEGMVDAGAECLWAGSSIKAEAKALEVYQAMIDKALEEG